MQKFLTMNHRHKFDGPHINVDVTLNSDSWGRMLSPFILGPVTNELGTSRNVENAWQYSKIFEVDLNADNTPKDFYWKWRKDGFEKVKADRYPRGKDNNKYVRGSWFGREGEPGKLLNYVESRKKIYVPAYLQALRNNPIYPTFIKFIADAWYSETTVIFRDYDTFNHEEAEMSLVQILNDERYKYGHGFILVDEAYRFVNSESIDFSDFWAKNFQ